MQRETCQRSVLPRRGERRDSAGGFQLVGVWLFPANGSQIAAVETDLTGTTRLSSVPMWHSFTIPMLVAWITAVAAGLLMSLVIQ